jgi:hypothetical protein
MKYFIIIGTFLFVSKFLSAQKSIQIELKIRDTLVDCEKDNFEIIYSINNNSVKQICVPKPIIMQNDNEYAGDASYEYQKYEDSLKRFVHFRYRLDELPYRTIQYQYINPKSKLVCTEPMSCILMKKGRYRIRIKLLFSKYNKSVKNISSNWSEFTIVKPLAAPM